MVTTAAARRLASGATSEQIIAAINLLYDVLIAQKGALPGATFTGPILLPDGTASAPAWAFAADTNNGAWRFGTDDWILVAGALNALRVKVVSGSLVGVGVGGVDPTHAFDVQQTKATDFIAVIEQLASSAGTGGLKVKSAATALSDPAFLVDSGGTTRFSVQGDGTIIGKGSQALQKATQTAVGSSDLTLGFSFASFSPVISVTLTVGEWAVSGTWHFVSLGDTGTHAQGALNVVSGSATITNQTSYVQVPFQVSGYHVESTRQWRVVVTSSAVIEMQALKQGGAGTSIAQAAYCTLTAQYVGNP